MVSAAQLHGQGVKMDDIYVCFRINILDGGKTLPLPPLLLGDVDEDVGRFQWLASELDCPR
jgi:hypothetical protein